MKNYVVYFEILGKKMKTTVKANNEFHARSVVQDKIKFITIREDSLENLFEQFKDIFK